LEGTLGASFGLATGHCIAGGCTSVSQRRILTKNGNQPHVVLVEAASSNAQVAFVTAHIYVAHAALGVDAVDVGDIGLSNMGVCGTLESVAGRMAGDDASSTHGLHSI
jgi:hypothetical protein